MTLYCRTKNVKYKGDVFESFQDSQNSSTAVDKTFRAVEIFLLENIIRFASCRKATMVGTQCQFINKQISDSTTTTTDYLDRCIKNKLGSFSH